MSQHNKSQGDIHHSLQYHLAVTNLYEHKKRQKVTLLNHPSASVDQWKHQQELKAIPLNHPSASVEIPTQLLLP
jgi:hypothetical protein